MPSNIRSRANEQQESKVHRTPNHRNKLIPSQKDKDAVHPNGNLADRADHTPLGLEVVGIGFATEAGGEIVGFGVGEDDEGGIEVELAVFGGGRVDGGGGGEGDGVGEVGRGDARVKGDESEDLFSQKRGEKEISSSLGENGSSARALTASLAFLKMASMSSSGFHTLGTPSSS